MATKKKAAPKKRATHRKGTSRKPRKRGSVRGDQSLAPSVVSGYKKKKRKPKKVGAITGNDTMDTLLGFGVGLMGSIMLNKLSTMENKTKAIIEVVVGGISIYVGTKKKIAFVTGFGMGALGVGLTIGAKEMGFINGMDEFMGAIGYDGVGEDTMLIEMNGIGERDINDTNIMSGDQDFAPKVISGGEEEMNGSENLIQGTSVSMPSVISGQDF